MRLAELRIPRAGLLAAVASFLAGALLAYFGRGLSFFSDEWTIIAELPGSMPRYFLEPHNEHWTTLLKGVYWLLLNAFGMGSYVPYMAVLGALHACAGLCLFWLVRRRSGELVALACLPLFLFMGRGWEDLLWAFQIGFVGAVAAGLAALLALDPVRAGVGRLALASALVLAGLTLSGGIGLVFLAAAGVELAVDRARRRHLLALAVPAAAYAAWYLAFGRANVAINRNPFTSAAAASLVFYIPSGIGAASAGLVGLSATWTPLGLGALAAIVVSAVAFRRRLDARVLGALAGLLALFGLTGLVRAQAGPEQVVPSRYIYIAAPFLLLVLSDAVKDLRPDRRWLVAGAAALVAATAYSSVTLAKQYRLGSERAALQDDELRVLGAVRGARDLDGGAEVDPDLAVHLTIAEYFRAVDAYGSPVAAVGPDGVGSVPSEAVDRVLRRGFAGRISIEGVGGVGQCRAVDPVAGAEVSVAQGGSVGYAQAPGVAFSVYLSYAGRPAGTPSMQLIPTSERSRIRLPDSGLPGSWVLRIEPPPNVPASICES
jgi:hypothetical protein